MEKNIENLFKKYVNNTLTKKEYEKLMDFFKNPDARNDVEKMMDGYWGELSNVEKGFLERKDDEVETLYRKITDKIENRSEKRKEHTPVKVFYISNLYKIAAVFILAAGLFFGYQKGVFGGNVVSTPDSGQGPAEDITLTLDDGRIEVMSETGQQKIIGPKGKMIGAQKGNQLNYQNTEVSEELVYNTLTVPYGKKFDLVLSDGSEVKLNAGSSIRYPVRFLKGKQRRVFLNGEAYFDVAKDEAHPFVVNANDMNVEVLGTEFNMSYYPEDPAISTVLVEGSVKLYASASEIANDDATILTPGHIAAWDKSTHEMSTKKVNTEIYTAWKDGVLLFQRMSFGNIRMKLERHFNISIENQYPFLEDQLYTASFANESLGEIMEAFKEDTPFEFELIDNRIIITDQPVNNLN